MNLISWNVNGLRACMGKGFLEFVAEQQPDMLCLQETKMQQGQADVPLEGGYHEYWNSAEKKGYSGVALFTKTEPQSVTLGLGIDGNGLHAECAGRPQASGLPHAVGGRLPRLPVPSGQG